jgi:hypothetical protein
LTINERKSSLPIGAYSPQKQHIALEPSLMQSPKPLTTAFTCRAGCKEQDGSKNRDGGPVKCNGLVRRRPSFPKNGVPSVPPRLGYDSAVYRDSILVRAKCREQQRACLLDEHFMVADLVLPNPYHTRGNVRHRIQRVLKQHDLTLKAQGGATGKPTSPELNRQTVNVKAD